MEKDLTGRVETLTKVSTREIDSEFPGVKVIFCIRNEKFRLSYFLEYYRLLGITEFFAIDNNSDDNTQAFLLEQSDVHVFYTDESYKRSNAGRDWTSELANKYCKDKWCLTLDVDEFLVYPFIEYVDINLFTDYLDRWGYEGLFSIFLDFYHSGPLSEASYEEGRSPFAVCDHFDSATSYKVFETPNFPFLQIKGGIRQRKFWDAADARSGPSMRKLVLIKWREGFEYLHSTHSSSSVRLADLTGVIAHFKFMSHFKEYSRSEVERNDRVSNSGDWKVYATALESEDVVFFDEAFSVKYMDSSSLLENGHMSCSLRYFDHVFRPKFRINSKNVKALQFDKSAEREKLATLKELASIRYSELNQVWPGVGLFSQTFGSNHKGAADLFRIDEDIDSLINSRYWKYTYQLRSLGARLGMCDQRSFPEDMKNQSIYSKFIYTYGSVWWDLTAPARLVVRIFRKLFR